MKTRLDKSIEYIRGYCSKISSCSECKCFDHIIRICSFKRMPMLWETLQEQEKKARYNNEN